MSAARFSFWPKWQARFAAYSQRERLLIAASVLVGVALLGSSALVEPQFLKLRQATQTQQTEQAELERLRVQLAQLQQRAAVDPDAAVRQSLTEAKSQLQEVEAALWQANAAMVPASEMNALLERLLRRQPRLQLLAMRSLPPVPLLTEKAAGASAEKNPTAGASAEFAIYRHGVEIRLAGSYADLQRYVAALEQDGRQLIWSSLAVQTQSYPRLEMTLTVSTLSMDKAWLTL